ncbi:MAG: carboxypeptidase-like regulatory domain-containing protein [Gemmatimonadaceae bacterium]
MTFYAGVALATSALTAQPALGALTVMVVGAETAFPLENARVALDPPGHESLTSAAGRVVFTSLPAGNYRLRTRRIGYIPSDTAIALGDGEQRQIRIVLVHAAVVLSTVRVVTYPPCRKPGLPDVVRQPELAALLVQMRLNAEQFRFLIQSRPIEYTIVRTSGITREQSGPQEEATDTLFSRLSHDGWRYRAGRVVTKERGVNASREQVMHLPKLDDLASEEFLRNHCFFYAGLEVTQTGPAIRIDFRAAERIRSPDVHGSIWLDSATYVIRSETLELSRIPRELGDVTGVRATTTFTEIRPGIPLFDTIDGVSTIRRGTGRDPVIELTETQKLLRVNLPPPAPRS